jgi:hypothetical protein
MAAQTSAIVQTSPMLASSPFFLPITITPLLPRTLSSLYLPSKTPPPKISISTMPSKTPPPNKPLSNFPSQTPPPKIDLSPKHSKLQLISPMVCMSTSPMEDFSKLHSSKLSPLSEKNKQALKKIIVQWTKDAKKRLFEAVDLHNKISEQRLASAFEILDLLLTQLADSSFCQSHTIYIAYTPQDRQIQGIASCILAAGTKLPSIEQLCTNPKNIAVRFTDSRVKKVGTALVKHISKDIQTIKDLRTRKLYVRPMYSSRKFYEQLGFIDDLSGDPMLLSLFNFSVMELNPVARETLLRHYQNLSITDLEPLDLVSYFSSANVRLVRKTSPFPVLESPLTIASPVISSLLAASKLHTAKVDMLAKNTLNLLASTMISWEIVANDRKLEASRCNNQIACDRLEALHDVANLVFFQTKSSQFFSQNRTLYCAYSPETMKLQGIAICSFQPLEHHYEVESLATHPRNIIVLQTDTRVSAVGTALMTHICRDMDRVAFNMNKTLSLKPLTSAAGFYKKLGFAPGQYMMIDPYWYLEQKARESLIKKNQDIAIMDKDPILLSKLS